MEQNLSNLGVKWRRKSNDNIEMIKSYFTGLFDRKTKMYPITSYVSEIFIFVGLRENSSMSMKYCKRYLLSMLP